jgi:hypothetical protein
MLLVVREHSPHSLRGVLVSRLADVGEEGTDPSTAENAPQ